MALADELRGRTQSELLSHWSRCRSAGARRLINGHKKVECPTYGNDSHMQGEVFKNTFTHAPEGCCSCNHRRRFVISSVLLSLCLWAWTLQSSTSDSFGALCCLQGRLHNSIQVLCICILAAFVNMHPPASLVNGSHVTAVDSSTCDICRAVATSIADVLTSKTQYGMRASKLES